jgi:hypothetical protein
MMGSTSQEINKEKQEWQNYQQALMGASAQKAAGMNSMIGSGAAAAGSVALGAAVII